MVRPRFVALALALVTLLVYLPVRHHGFLLFDDPDYLTDNATVQAGLSWAGLQWALTTWHANNWHPITWLSHMLDCDLFGLDAGAHHLVSALIHAANAALLFTLLWRLTRRLWPAAVVAALFAWHPLRVESVAWIAERKDVLSALFGLLTLHAYVRYVESRSSAGAGDKRPPRRDRRFYGLTPVLGCFALGLLAKPMLVTLPFVFLLLDYWPLQRSPAGPDLEPPAPAPEKSSVAKLSWRSLVAEKWPFFALAAGSAIVTVLAQRAEAIVGLTPCPLEVRVGNAILSYGRYLLKTFWPADLAVLYPLSTHVPWVSVLAAAVVLVALSAYAWHFRQSRPHVLVGWLWFLGTLVPVIGLVQVGGQAMADRYTYIPSIGLCLALVWEAARWRPAGGRSAPATAAIAALVLVAAIACTDRQLRYWQDTETLFTHTLAVTTDNAVAHVNLGVALEAQGHRTPALRHYLEAVRINPDLAQAQNNLANLQDELGQSDDALSHYQAALRLKPNALLIQLNLGTLLVKLGRFAEAKDLYTAAAKAHPNDARPHYLLGKAWLRQNRSSEALAEFREALRRNPDDLPTLICLARFLAACSDPAMRNGPQAVAIAERANELTEGKRPAVLDVLAMAYAETGRYPDAQQAARRALEQISATEPTNTSAIQDRLRLYEASQPYRESISVSP